MITAVEFEKIKKKATGLLKFQSEYEFEYVQYNGVSVAKSGNKITIGGDRKTSFYRGFMLAAAELKKGNEEFSISEKRHFEELGFSLDLSRNGVIKVDKIKKIIDVMALLGFSYIQLYMEDVFELPGYPHFGYRRGKYTHDELREIDDYAYEMGLEAVPSVQTLGHLAQYLRYKEANGFRENINVLLCGKEETYEFVETIVKTMRSCFRTKRLTINCDEAGGVGIRQMKQNKQYVSPYDVVMPHLDRVMKICAKYDFTCNVCGDLFYGHLGKGYYDFEFKKPSKEELSKIPDVDIVFWDYYHTNYEDYENLIKGHSTFGKKLIFWGGIWMWCGQLPQTDFTFRTMEPGLKCCLDYKITDVLAANYCDDGNETNIMMSLPQLLIFSEYCFKGNEYKREDVYELSKYIFEMDMEMLIEISNYHYPWVENLTRAEYIWPNYMGKRIFYSDILLNMVGTYDFEEILSKHKKALDKVNSAKVGNEWQKYCEYIKSVLEITTLKMQLMTQLNTAYKAGDKETLSEMSEKLIPELREKYEKIMLLHEEQWLSVYKPFGWEELNNRYGATIARLSYAERIIEKYVSGVIDSIPELEAEFIEEPEGCFPSGGCVTYNQIKSVGI